MNHGNSPNELTITKGGLFVGSQGKVNFIEGAGITLTVTNDSANNEIDVTVTNSGGGGGLSDGDYGDVTVTGSGTIFTIDTGAVTYAKLQATSAASVLLGRGQGSGAGTVQELTLGTGLTMTGTVISSTITQYTDEMARDALGAALVAGSNITITPNDGADTITISASTGGISDGDKGDITVSASGTTWTIDNDVVTFAKQQNVATGVFLGRLTAGTGDIETLTLTSFGASLLDDADATAARTTLGLGTAATQATSAFEVPLTFSTGLTRTINTITVNTSQNIATLSNLTGNGFVKTSGGVGTLSIDTNTYLTGNQSITLSGDVTGSGATAITTTLATVNSNVGSFGLAGSVAQFTVNAKGLITAAANVAISIAATAISDSTAAGRAMLTAATAAAQTALLDVFTSGAKGLTPASGGGTTNFLRADGTWAVPSGGGGGGGNAVTATVDFGASFTDMATVTVTGQTWVTTSSNIVAQVLNENLDEAYLLDMKPIINNRVNGVGFDVSILTDREATGTYSVMCVGV